MLDAALSGLKRVFSIGIASQPTTKFAIQYPSLMNMFQLLNPNIFEIRENVPADDKDILALAYTLNAVGNPSAEHLAKDDELLKVTLLSQHVRDDGALISYVEYTHTDRDKGDENYACLMIASLDHFDGRPPEFTVHFSFSAQFQPSEDTFALVINHALCLKDNKEMEYRGAEHQIEFYGVLAYANQAFLQLLMGQKIDCAVNKNWFDKLSKASEVVSSIRTRTATTLAKTIARLESKQQDAPETHTPQAPS